MLYRDSVVLLFAKAPVEGKVNTRLIADIGVSAATELQRDLIHGRLSMLTKAKLCDVRLLCAPDRQHAQYRFCIVIGTDAPALDGNIIKQALEILHEGTEVVFVPAEDGGYVLVGMSQAYDFLFQDINWGAATVMQQSRNKLDKNNIAYGELADCWDVDRLEDYQRYSAMLKN
jgi:glycosyltransferase A (GT-A) superfamily protein (DUF2064 family)